MFTLLLEAKLPEQFFTIQSMLTLTGAAGATYVICNGLQRALNFNPRWLALAIAISISVYGTYETSPGRVSDYFVAVINGFLIFCTSAGATELGAVRTDSATARGAGGVTAPNGLPVNPHKRKFRSSWF